jgi:hypothetical protein
MTSLPREFSVYFCYVQFAISGAFPLAGSGVKVLIAAKLVGQIFEFLGEASERERGALNFSARRWINFMLAANDTYHLKRLASSSQDSCFPHLKDK